jgi:hypothetical protein
MLCIGEECVNLNTDEMIEQAPLLAQQLRSAACGRRARSAPPCPDLAVARGRGHVRPDETVANRSPHAVSSVP